MVINTGSQQNVNSYTQSILSSPNANSVEAKKNKSKLVGDNAAAREAQTSKLQQFQQQQLDTNNKVAKPDSTISERINQLNKDANKAVQKKASDMYKEVQAQTEKASESKAHEKYVKNQTTYTKGSIVSSYV